MKKFLILFFLGILLGSGVFVLGWVQFRLSPGESALLFSKTNGWEDRIIESGDFEWRWQALLPTNLKVFRFTPSASTFTYRFEKQLPGSSLYGIDIDPANFVLGFTVDISTTLSKDGYRGLIINQGLGSDGEYVLSEEARDGWFETIVGSQVQSKIDLFGTDLLGLYAFGEGPREFSSLLPELRTSLASSEDYNLEDFSVREIIQPNAVLFRTLQDRYLALTQASISGAAEAENQLARTRAIEQALVRRMENYGQVLEKYPSILDYLRIVGETNIDPLEISTDRNTSYPISDSRSGN